MKVAAERTHGKGNSIHQRSSLSLSHLARRLKLRRLFVYGLILAFWELAVRLLDVPEHLVPAPSRVFVALARGISTGTYIDNTVVTVGETVAGFVIAAVLAFVVAALIVEIRLLEEILLPLIVGLQSLPKVALAPLILIWAGYGMQSKVIVAALVAFFPIVVNTLSGLRAFDREAGELFRSLEASRWQLLMHLRLPSALPYMIAGLTVGWVFALLGAIVGEFIGSQAGLGFAILQLQFALDTAGVFAILIILGVIGMSGHAILGAIGKRFAFWSGAHSSAKEGQA